MECPGPSGLSGAKKPKKKEPRLTYSEKIEIIKLLDENNKQSDVAERFNKSQCAISRIYAKRHQILQNKGILEKENISLNRKRFSDVITSDREHKLVHWLNQNQAAGVPINGRSIQEAAVVFNEACNGPNNFKAGSGFLHKFKKRHCIRSLSMQGEKLSADSDAAADFREIFRRFVSDFGFGRDQIYNADETGLLWKCLPGRTMTQQKSASGWKLQKDRVTLMFWANASGCHRIPLLMIGKYKTPHCLRNMNISALPVSYTNQRNAWMDKICFMEWYQNIFLPEITSKFKDTGKKCILVLDNAPTHPDEETLNAVSDMCSVIYLPPNVTSLMQPMDQGVIEKFKRLYRQNMLRSLLVLTNHPQTVPKFIKEMNIYKCIVYCNQAWNALTAENLANAWRKMFGSERDSEINNDDEEDDDGQNFLPNVQMMPEFQNLTASDLTTWYSNDDIFPGWEFQTMQEIAATSVETSAIVEDEEEEEEQQQEEDMESRNGELPPSSSAVEFEEKFQQWCFSRWDFSPEQYAVLNSVVQTASNVAYDDKFLKN